MFFAQTQDEEDYEDLSGVPPPGKEDFFLLTVLKSYLYAIADAVI